MTADVTRIVTVLVAWGGGFLVAGAIGCSSGRPERTAQLGAETVEPELATRAVAGRAGRLVPQVIRPARSARPAAGHRPAPEAARSPVFPAGHLEPQRASQADRPVDVFADATLAEIRDMLAGYLRAFNRHDAVALAAHWTAEGENVDLDSGEVTSGREELAAVFTGLFTEDSTAAMQLDVSGIRRVRADVAIVDGSTRIDFEDGDAAASRFSAVVVRQDGHWLLDSVRETAQPATEARRRPLDELEWLVGSWEDVGQGLTASSRCFWSAGRAFLIRTHAISPDVAPEPPADSRAPGLLPSEAETDRELTEIIGWDPERGVIRSWMFTSAGRFAEATWHRDGDAWRVHVEGRGADGDRDCECTLVRLSPDELSFRTAGLGDLAGAVPPACDFVRTAR